jgi:hypothetical protein
MATLVQLLHIMKYPALANVHQEQNCTLKLGDEDVLSHYVWEGFWVKKNSQMHEGLPVLLSIGKMKPLFLIQLICLHYKISSFGKSFER